MEWYSDCTLEIFKNRKEYIIQYNDAINKISDLNKSKKLTDYDAHLWTGKDIKNYLELFKDFDFNDFEVQILFEK